MQELVDFLIGLGEKYQEPKCITQAKKIKDGEKSLVLKHFRSDVLVPELDNLAQLLTNNNFITELDLSYNDIGDLGLTKIAGIFKFNNAITTLKISRNQIVEEGITALLAALQNNHTLLHINNNEMNGTAITKLANFLNNRQHLIC